MAVDLNLVDYIPMLLGGFGAVTGFLSYLNSKNFKSLDLRLELRKSCQELLLMHESVKDLLGLADKSRKAIYSASGQLDSGSMVKWSKQYEQDRAYLLECQIKLLKVFHLQI